MIIGLVDVETGKPAQVGEAGNRKVTKLLEDLGHEFQYVPERVAPPMVFEDLGYKGKHDWRLLYVYRHSKDGKFKCKVILLAKVGSHFEPRSAYRTEMSGEKLLSSRYRYVQNHYTSRSV